MVSLRDLGSRSLRAPWLTMMLLAALTGCAPQMALDDSVVTSSLSEQKTGVILFWVDLEGHRCDAGAVHFATETGPGRFTKFAHYSIGNTTSDVLQVKLPAGTYHVGVVACVQGQRFVNAGTHDGSTLIGNPLKSMAAFVVGAGEVVNLGRLRLDRPNIEKKEATARIEPMSGTTLDLLRTTAPKVFAQMTTRLMTSKAGETYSFDAVLLPGQAARTTYMPIYR